MRILFFDDREFDPSDSEQTLPIATRRSQSHHDRGLPMDFDEPLGRVAIRTPCPMDWDRMIGDDRKRFCAHAASKSTTSSR